MDRVYMTGWVNKSCLVLFLLNDYTLIKRATPFLDVIDSHGIVSPMSQFSSFLPQQTPPLSNPVKCKSFKEDAYGLQRNQCITVVISD